MTYVLMAYQMGSNGRVFRPLRSEHETIDLAKAEAESDTFLSDIASIYSNDSGDRAIVGARFEGGLEWSWHHPRYVKATLPEAEVAMA